MPALGSRHTEAEAVTESILVHGPTVVRAGSTPIVICLTEPSSITSRADTECSGSLWQEFLCWQRFPPQESSGSFPGIPLYPGGHWHWKLLSPGIFSHMAIPWQRLGKQESFRSSQTLPKVLAMSKQQLVSCGKLLCIELFWQEFKRHLVLFLSPNESRHLESLWDYVILSL